jgi:hypothetical protein
MNNMQLPNPSGISNIYKLHADPTLHAPLSTPTKHPHTGCAGQVLQLRLAAGAPLLVLCAVQKASTNCFLELIFTFRLCRGTVAKCTSQVRAGNPKDSR